MPAPVLYVQPDGKAHPDGSVTGKLVMIGASGARNEYNFTSSGKSESRGPLPGLVSDQHLLPDPNRDAAKPQAVYKIGRPVPTSRFITSNHDKNYGYFYPIQSASVTERDSFGIHPSGGDGTTTLGCIGLDDESAKRFLADMRKLGSNAPRELEVYRAEQNVGAILAARQQQPEIRTASVSSVAQRPAAPR
jgi:hypothetical protein